jgi:hypothetical protein
MAPTDGDDAFGRRWAPWWGRTPLAAAMAEATAAAEEKRDVSMRVPGIRRFSENFLKNGRKKMLADFLAEAWVRSYKTCTLARRKPELKE